MTATIWFYAISNHGIICTEQFEIDGAPYCETRIYRDWSAALAYVLPEDRVRVTNKRTEPREHQ